MKKAEPTNKDFVADPEDRQTTPLDQLKLSGLLNEHQRVPFTVPATLGLGMPGQPGVRCIELRPITFMRLQTFLGTLRPELRRTPEGEFYIALVEPS